MPIDLGQKYFSCEKCGGKAKRVSEFKKVIDHIFGKKLSPGVQFKCRKCGHVFTIIF